MGQLILIATDLEYASGLKLVRLTMEEEERDTEVYCAMPGLPLSSLASRSGLFIFVVPRS